MKLKNRRMLSFLMAIVMVLTMIPFHPLEVKAAATPTIELGNPVRVTEATYQLPNAAFGSTGVVNAAGGYFTVAVNNGSIAVGTLSSGITELTNGITISDITTDQSTPANRVFNFSSGTTYEEIQAVIRNMIFTQVSGQTQSATVNVTPGAPLTDRKTSVRTYNGRHFVYVARQSTMGFKDAVDIATNNHGHLLEPTAFNPGEMLAIASMFKEFKSPFTESWYFISFIGATKTTALSSWSTSSDSATHYVSNNGQHTNLESPPNYYPNGDDYVHLTLLLDTNNTAVKYLGVNNTHGISSGFFDPGVIVEYNSGVINIITATKDIELPAMGGSVTINGIAKVGQTLTANVTGITYTPNAIGNVPTYQWYRNGVAITNTTDSGYTLTADDLGATITVTVTADGTHAAGSVTSAATAPVTKGDGPTAPSAPVASSVTPTSITLTAVTGQEYSKDGGVTWQDSPTFSGLTSDTQYSFVTRVKETATQSASAISAATAIRTLASASNESGNTGGSPTTPTTPVTPKPDKSGIETSVNNKDDSFATGKTSTSGERKITSVQVDPNKLNTALSQGSGQKLSIRSASEGDVKVDGLTAADIKQIADKGASLEIGNPLAIYPVPGGKMDLSGVSKQLGNAALGDIAVHIDITRSSDALINNAKSKAAADGYELLVTPVDLDLTFTGGGKTVRSEQLNGYASKYIALPEGIDPNRITTGVIVNPDGSVFHVPTVVTKISNRYYAMINDLRSNGSYSVIWNPQDFDDVKNHWGKTDVNNIAARLDLAGTGNNTFSPNRNVTRSEFSEIVISGLGLMRQNAPQNIFPDVPASAWYRNSVAIANEFDIVRGYDDGNFNGNQQITREQGIAMIARAYNLIEPQAALAQDRINSLLAQYEDAASVSAWARAEVAQLIAAGIVQGNGPQLLSPQANMTRAEVTALIARLLKTTNLIDK